MSPAEDDEIGPSEKRPSDEKKVSNVSNSATSEGVMKSSDTSDGKPSSDTSGGKPSTLDGNNQIPRKKRVTFDEVVTILDESPPGPHPTEPQKLRSILRKPKTGFSTTDGSSFQSEPPRAKKRDLNLVSLNQIKFRFVLHESLPSKLNVELQVKDADEREKNFEILKAWVDFRHFLFAQLDPQKSAKIRLENQKIYSIQSRHVKTLTALQKNNEIQSVFSVSPARLKGILGIRFD